VVRGFKGLGSRGLHMHGDIWNTRGKKEGTGLIVPPKPSRRQVHQKKDLVGGAPNRNTPPGKKTITEIAGGRCIKTTSSSRPVLQRTAEERKDFRKNPGTVREEVASES